MSGLSIDIQLKRGGHGLSLRLPVCLALALACAIGANAWSQTNDGGVQLMPPPIRGLSPVQLPDTRSMELGAREHIREAESALARVVKDTSRPAFALGEAYGEMGEIYHAYSLNKPARECYLNASRLAEKDFRWVYLLGKLYEREGDALKAISYYNAARTLRPDYLPVFVGLGNLYLQLNRLEEAETSYKSALEITDTSAAAAYGLGQAALSKRNYIAAAGFLEKALRHAPEATRLHYALAMAYRGLGDMEKAQSHLAQSGTIGVRASDPLFDGLQDLIKGARLHLIRGKSALEARRFAEAAEEFRKAIVEQPDSIPAHFNLGAALTQTGDLRGAIEQFRETLRLDAAHANAHYNLGLLLAQMNEHEEAITNLQAAVNASPNDTGARFLLAQELVKSNRLKEAEEQLSRIVQVEPSNEDALLALARLFLERKDYKQALSTLERGHAQFPQNGRTVVLLARLLAAVPQLDLRDGARALGLAQSAYETAATISHGALVAMALAELGRCDEAAAWTKRMIAKAEGEGNADAVEKLKAELKRYESARPCRPL